MVKTTNYNELQSLMNVGKATLHDFELLEVTSIDELAKCCPDDLFVRLQEITGKKQDPCVWDVFASAINEARTGEKSPWWHWSKVRKKRQKEGDFEF